MKTTFLTAALMVTAIAAPALAQTGTDMYPAPKSGYTRHILEIPQAEHQGNMRVEIVAGLDMEVDCNHVMIGADLEEEILTGWGYTYYEIKDVSKPASTMMGCPDNSKSVKFVTVNLGQDAMVRYNDKLPIVVYAPENLKVGYRIWQTDGKLHGQAE